MRTTYSAIFTSSALNRFEVLYCQRLGRPDVAKASAGIIVALAEEL